MTDATQGRCRQLRSLHVQGSPLILPNAWDAASARAVASVGLPAVATTSGGVAAALGYEDHEGAPGDEMLAAAARIVGSVDVPVTVDAEAGYGMAAADLVAALRRVGAAGCNLEDTNHPSGRVREPAEQAAWLRAVRGAATDQGYGLVLNARIDTFLATVDKPPRPELIEEALNRAHAYFEAGADCVYPIALWERDALARFVAGAGGPVNVLAGPRAPAVDELARLGVARISWGSSLHRRTMEWFERTAASLAPEAGDG